MNIYQPNTSISALETGGEVQHSLKRLFVAESLKQMGMFPSKGQAPNGFGQGTFESFLIEEYARHLANWIKL